MKAADIKEAGEIITGLQRLDQLQRKLPYGIGGFGMVRAVGPNFDRHNHRADELPLTEAAAAAAMTVMRRDWKATEAKLRRRAAQIGLTLED